MQGSRKADLPLPKGYIWVESKEDLPPEIDFRYFTKEELRSSIDTFNPYPCEFCSRGFWFIRQRATHYLREHLCEVCQKNVSDLAGHQRKGHRKCPHCETLVYTDWFKSHVLHSHGEKAWADLVAKQSVSQKVVCRVCHRRFKTQRSLDQHSFDVHRK